MMVARVEWVECIKYCFKNSVVVQSTTYYIVHLTIMCAGAYPLSRNCNRLARKLWRNITRTALEKLRWSTPNVFGPAFVSNFRGGMTGEWENRKSEILTVVPFARSRGFGPVVVRQYCDIRCEFHLIVIIRTSIWCVRGLSGTPPQKCCKRKTSMQV
jgi:hypothetical protein